MDSTILADAVATQDTVTQLVSGIRRVAREVPGAAGQIAAVCTGHDYSKPGKPKIDWDDPAAKDALVSALVNDATAVVVVALQDRDLDERAASALLALVAGQDVEPAEGSDGTDGRWNIARKVAEDRVISVRDPDALHTRKSPEALCRATTRTLVLSWCFLGSSGCSSVLVDQAVDDLSALDPGGHIDRLAGLVQRRPLLPRLVGPMFVVVPRVLGQDLPEVAFTVDQQAVQALAPQRPCIPLREGVGPHRQQHLIQMIGTDVCG